MNISYERKQNKNNTGATTMVRTLHILHIYLFILGSDSLAGCQRNM